MPTPKALIALFSLIAFASNPLTAAMMPCSCTERSTHDCCLSLNRDGCQSTATNSCCSRTDSDGPSEKSDPPCCCVKSPPAVKTNEAAFDAYSAQQLIAVLTVSKMFDVVSFPVGAAYSHQATPSKTCSLQILYCVWLI
jgi:hypothetical protein